MYTASVIIPMYNESKYIARCLESLIDQSMKDFEVILIDDWSTDNTKDIASLFHNRLSLTILQQQHGGPGKARNRWAQQAQSDIIIFVDADMCFDSHYIEELLKPILTWEEVWTSHGIEKVGNPENIWARSWSINRIPNPQPRSPIYRAILRNIFLEVGWFDSTKGYFDDNLSTLNQGKWAKTIMTAICFHNNPTTLAEAYKHSIWVWKSLFLWSEWKTYFARYKWRLTVFFILFLGGISLRGWSIFLYGFIALILLLEYAAWKRIIKEHDIEYIRSIPILMITRGIGYIIWIVTSLFSKK